MVFGFTKGPSILETRQIEDQLLFAVGDLQKEDEAWLITPYLTIDKLSTLRRQITEACKRGANVNVVIRDEPDQVQPALKGFSEALSYGLSLYAFHRLHAKVYWFGNIFSIVTSANLVDGSFEGSTEIGIITNPGPLHEDLRDWINDVIEPGLKSISSHGTRQSTSGRSQRATQPKGARTSQEGLCIRCAKAIPLNIEKPYCLEHYRNWDQYRNPDYEENVCHACGKPDRTSMAKPLCYACFRKLK